MKYDVAAMSPNGKSEKFEIEADSMGILDGVEESLILFKKRTKVVLAIPQSSFVSAHLQSPPKEVQLKIVGPRRVS